MTAGLEVHRRNTLGQVEYGTEGGRLIISMNDIEEGFRQQLGLGKAQYGFKRWIDAFESTIGMRHEHQIDGEAEDPFAFFLACLGRRVAAEVVGARRGIPSVKRADDGYGA